MASPRQAGRYVLHDAIASGGMASVHLGRVVGSAGFTRVVAIKRLHPHLSGDPEFVEMFLDEARLASRIHHPNVVATLDVVTDEAELLLVMDHILGESWWTVLRDAREGGIAVPLDVVSAVIGNMLSGLHAAHEARSETGVPLEIVHRDVSPQNVLVGVDGISRVVDFGIAKAISRIHSTRDGELKGKLRYMSPEQILRTKVDRRADIYAAAVVLWESLTGDRLFTADDAAGTIAAVLEGGTPAPSRLRPEVPRALDQLTLSALARELDERPSTALDFTIALEQAVPPASSRVVGDFLAHVVGPKLEARRRAVAEVEAAPSERRVGSAATASMSPSERRVLAAANTAVSQVAAAPSGTVLPVAEGGTTTATMTDAPIPVRQGRRRERVVLILVALVSVIGVGIAGVGLARRAPPRAPAEVAASNNLVSAPIVSTAPVEQASASPAPASPEPPKASSGRRVRRPGPIAPPAPRATASAPPKPVDDCNPAYTIDANGVKRFKPGCI